MDTPPTQNETNNQNEALSPAVTIDVIENLMEKERNTPNHNHNHHEQQQDSINNIKSYKHHSLSLLNSNKQLVLLELKQTNNIIPRGLLSEITSTIRLSDSEKDKWQGILKSCGRQLRNLLIQHHKDKIHEHMEKRDKLKRKIPPQNLHTINKEIMDHYEENKRRRTSLPHTPRTLQTSRTPHTPTTPRTPQNVRNSTSKN